jgi:glycerol-3-phosphate dehydrogenase (NAD(P)+)
MAKIAVIGSGSYGTALAKVFSERNQVLIYSIEPDVIMDINTSHMNSKYLPSAKLNSSITATGDLAKASDADIMILAVPSSAVKPASASLKPFYKGQLIISTSKGLSRDGKVMTDLIEEALGCPKNKVLALSGPSIATELAEGKCTQVMIGGEFSAARKAKAILETDNLLIKQTSDKKGIQLLGFYKNILAILSGISDGLDMGNNFKAALIAHAYHEFYYLNTGRNIARHTFVDAAGLGDLYVTAISDDSRNRRFGKFLAEGMSPEEIKLKVGTVIEGYENLKVMRDLAEKEFIDENLLNILHSLITKKLPKTEMISMLKSYLGASELKALVFDWGNVLTEGNYSVRVAELLSKQHGYEKSRLLRDLEKHEKEALLGDEPFASYHKRIQALYPKINKASFLSAFRKAIVHDKAMLDYCRSLKPRYRLYLLSNNYNVVSPILRKEGLTSIFDGAVFSNEVHLIKPNKGIFQYLLNKYSLRPKNCLFIDDMKANVLAAEKAGLTAIQFKSLSQLKAYLEKKSL